MTTEYRISVDRAACEGVFACLVRDDRFREAADGLATVGDAAEPDDPETGTVTATFDDDRLAEAESAAAACPVDAITVEVADE
jgi:ferredoxin